MNDFSKLGDFLSNKYLILLVFIVCIYFVFKTFTKVEYEKNNINVSFVQNMSTNRTENTQYPKFDAELTSIDNTLPNPFLSNWLRQKAIEEKKRLDAEAEARRIEEERKAEEEKRRLEEERIAKEKAEAEAAAQKNQQAQQNPDQQNKQKTVQKPKQKKQFRYIGYTLVNNQQLILIEIIENSEIKYIKKDETIENYKVESFDNEKLELSKDGNIYTIQRGNIVLLEVE
jgi:flagellar biosynthesis GTPase FlhF